MIWTLRNFCVKYLSKETIMTKQVYKTAQGKTIDMGSLALQHEHVRAVGNMNVNARGDMLDDKNRVISTRPQQVNQQYNKQIDKQQGKQ